MTEPSETPTAPAPTPEPAVPGWLRASPSLGVVTSAPPPAALVPLLAGARRWCRVMVLTAEVVDAVVVGHPDLIGHRRGPLAVWVATVADMELAPVSGADVVLSGLDEVIEQAGARGLLVPAGSDHPVVTAAAPVAPFVRRRFRAARNLPECLIVAHDRDGWVWAGDGLRIPSELADTALGCASAAVVTDPAALVAAMAWGTPCVTDDATRSSVAARTDREVLVADTLVGRIRLARAVAEDDNLASRLSWAGRSLVEARHCPGLVAARLVRRLGLSPASPLPGPGPLVARLAELGAQHDTEVARRLRLATLAFAGARD